MESNATQLQIGAANALHPAFPQQGAEGFAKALDHAQRSLAPTGSLKFSTHAMARIERRNIPFNDALQSRLNTGVQSLASKGSKEGLVVVDENRFLVSITNKTVITAMTAKDRDIYTNIDGVVFA